MPDDPQAADSTMSPRRTSAQAAPAVKALSGPQRALRKLGLLRDIDLALHLPMRYLDETRLAPIAALRDGDTAQVQGRVVSSRVESRKRRQLVVRLADDSGELVMRLLHFYPSQHKTLAEGALVRARGELRGGFFGREMVHPEWRIVQPDTPLPAALTPVYPASAQLPQAYLRKAVVSALARAPLDELLPATLLPPGLPTLREALHRLHHPAPGQDTQALHDPRHPAWQRLKFDELLAQQLSQARSRAERAALAARCRLR
jgi:ATP-dependent DNA helicase RecG